MKIPFSIKYRPQIESGEYKVVLDCGIEAEILAWDSPGEYPIICIAKKEDAIPFRTDNAGHAYHYPLEANYSDLLLEPELTEFEKALSKCLCDAVVRPEEEDYDKWAKEYAPELLELARKEIEEELKEKVLHDFWKQAADQCAEARKAAKAEALKNLPRWKKCTKDTLRSYGDEHFEYRRDGCYVVIRGREILLSDLEKLPKEDEK